MRFARHCGCPKAVYLFRVGVNDDNIGPHYANIITNKAVLKVIEIVVIYVCRDVRPRFTVSVRQFAARQIPENVPGQIADGNAPRRRLLTVLKDTIVYEDKWFPWLIVQRVCSHGKDALRGC